MNKKYFDTIDSLKPSQSAVDSAVQAALVAEQSGKVIEMKHNKKRSFTIAGVIAASLALVIALGAVFFPSSPKIASSQKANDNSFVLKVNAAELNEKDFTPIATLKRDGGSHVIFWEDDNTTERPDSDILTFDYKFSLECDGVKDYTCKVTNGTFGIEKAGYLADAKAAEKPNKALSVNEYSAFSVDSASDTDKADIRLISAIDMAKASPAVKRAVGLSEHIYYDKAYDIEEIKKDLNTALTNALEKLTVKVTARFDDGSTAEKSISFHPEVDVHNFEKIPDNDGGYGYDYDVETTVSAKTV